MAYYDQQILSGLTKVPTPNSPGSLIVTGNAQAVLTYPNPGNTVMAACELGNGKVFVAAHDCYLNWLHDSNRSEATAKFNRNLKSWLCGNPDLPDSEIIELGKLVSISKPFNDYKIIKWSHGYDPSEQVQQQLFEYIQNGGALFGASTPWGYLQIYPNKTLQDMKLHNFIKNLGILFTSECLWLPDEVDVTANRAKHSQFDMALQKVTHNPQKIGKYFNTITCGLEPLNREGILPNERILQVKDLVIVECQNCGWNPVPLADRPVRSQEERNATNLLGRCLHFTDGEKAPGIENFPGDFDQTPELLENVELNLSTKFAERISTGYFLPAGVQLVVELIGGDWKNWGLRIGAHTDDLSGCNELRRWPCVTSREELKRAKMNVSSPFGGLIYFESPQAGSIRVNLTNVVEAPFIDLTQPETIRDWSRRRNAPGLWAELAGENIIFTSPSRSVRHLENPVKVLKLWDDVVRTHHECRGTDVKSQRRERVVNDKQPSAGYMHSGYPIVTHLDCSEKEHPNYIFDYEKLTKNGNWGLFHEIGHNMQRGEWTFDGSGEVTVNIFSMHANSFVLGQQDVVSQEWPKNVASDFPKYFQKTPTYEDWKQNCGMALMTFVQLIKHFGWKAMHKFMKDYEHDIESNRSVLPKNNQEKIDQWVIRYSKIVGRNIKPQFVMFGLPVSESVDAHLKGLRLWCPVEEKDPKVFFSNFLLK